MSSEAFIPIVRQVAPMELMPERSGSVNARSPRAWSLMLAVVAPDGGMKIAAENHTEMSR